MLEIVPLSVMLALGGLLAATSNLRRWGARSGGGAVIALLALLLGQLIAPVLAAEWPDPIRGSARHMLGLSALLLGLRAGHEFRRKDRAPHTITLHRTVAAAVAALVAWALFGALIGAHTPADWLTAAPAALLTLAVGLAVPTRLRSAAPVVAVALVLALGVLLGLPTALGVSLASGVGLGALVRCLPDRWKRIRVAVLVVGVLALGVAGLDTLAVSLSAGITLGVSTRDDPNTALAWARLEPALLIIPTAALAFLWPLHTSWPTLGLAAAFAILLALAPRRDPKNNAGPRTWVFAAVAVAAHGAASWGTPSLGSKVIEAHLAAPTPSAPPIILAALSALLIGALAAAALSARRSASVQGQNRPPTKYMKH